MKYGQKMGSEDAVTLNLTRELDSTDYSMPALERLNF